LPAAGGMDSAGLGELVLLHMWAESEGETVKLVGANAHVRELLETTNLSSLFEIHSSLAGALGTADAMAQPV
jgi:anti-anti-sigma regulatory factor